MIIKISKKKTIWQMEPGEMEYDGSRGKAMDGVRAANETIKRDECEMRTR